MKRTIALSLVMLLAASPAFAKKVYKETSPSGTASYSDTPSQNSEEIILPKMQTYSSKPYQDAMYDSATNQDEEDVAIPYQLVISQPENGVTVGKDIETLNVKVYVNPELSDKHLIQLHLNDTPHGSPQRAKEFTLSELARGTYQIKAVIIHSKKQDKIIKESASIEVYVQRAKLPANKVFSPFNP